MIKKLTKGIEESKKEKESLATEEEKLLCTFKRIKLKSFVVKEDYNKIHELFHQHSASLNDAKNEYVTLKKTVDQLRSSEVDANYNLQNMKKTYKDLELKGKGHKKKLDDLLIALSKHIEQ